MQGFVNTLKRYGNLLKTAVGNWSGDRAPSMGAAIAYYTFFSMAPMLILVIAIAGIVFGRDAAQGALFGELSGMIGADSAAAVEAILASADNKESGIIASVVGFGTLVFAATAAFGELQSALNIIWKAKAPTGLGIWYMVKSRLLSLALVFGIGFMLMVSLVTSAALTAFSNYLDRFLPGLPIILGVVHLIVSLAFATAFFGMMFKVLPDTAVQWRDVWVGAAATAILFTLGKTLIGFYLGNTHVASAYGAAGALVVVLVWVYYSAQILLFGAELAKTYGDLQSNATGTGQPPPMQVAVVN